MRPNKLLSMPMDIAGWKASIYDNLWKLRLRMEEYQAKSLSGLLSGVALWPVIQAAQQGDIAAILAFGKLAGEIGSNVLADRLNAWTKSVTSEQQAVDTLENEVATHPELQEALDRLLVKLDVLDHALQQQKKEQQWFEEKIQAEWGKSGRAERIDAWIHQQVGVNQGQVIGKLFKVEQQHIYFFGGMVNEKQEPDVRRRYLLNLHRECCTLPLATFRYAGKPEEKQAVSLETVYIDLNTDTRVLMDGSPLPVSGKTLTGEEETRLLTVDEAVHRHKHLVLLGEAGSGKSTYIKHDLARRSLRLLEADATDELLPMLITLRDLAAELETRAFPKGGKARRNALADAVVAHLQSELKRLWAEGFSGSLQEMLVAGHCVIAYDGLDEVPVQLRGLVRDAITCVQEKYSPARTFITCRVRSYHGDAELTDYPVFKLAPLDDEQILRFCTGWYGAHAKAGTYTTGTAEKKGTELGEAALTLPEMAANPMLLTTLAIVHQQDNRLPHQRVVLYERAVDILLVKWQDYKTGLEAAASKTLADFLMDPERVRKVIESMAFAAHQGGLENPERDASADLSRGDAITLLEDFMEGDTALAREFLDYIDIRAGLFVGRGESRDRPAVYGFVHRTFQEYLAGSFLVSRAFMSMAHLLKQLSESGDYWSLVVQLGMEELLYNGNNRANILFDIATVLCPARETMDTQDDHWQALWSARIADLLGKEDVASSEGIFEKGEDYLDRLRSRLISCLGGSLPPIERAEAGVLLGKLGDPREEVTSVEKMAFCYVPAGPFIMGTTADEFEEDIRKDDTWKIIIGWATPKREETLAHSYWIGKHPVTWGQYARFIDEKGYEKEAYWTKAGWKQKEEKGWSGPEHYREGSHLMNHPVVGISWYEAHAYTNWLQAYLQHCGLLPEDWTISLPGEAEWEKASRGGLHIPVEPLSRSIADGLTAELPELKPHPEPGQIYSWGNELEENNLNYFGTGIGRPSAPGCFERDISRYGVQDLLGNVLEWTANRWTDTYPESKEERQELEAPEGTNSRVWRGGAFDDLEYYCRCAYRDYFSPDYRLNYVGFRIVLRPSR